jgi:3-hydroxyisobutyrate dehydrogenase
MAENAKARVGFIGVGVMGQPMAANLVKAGHEVTLYDANAERAKAVAAEIGAKTGSLADLAQGDFVVCMLPTGKEVRQVFFETDGGAFAKNIKKGLIAIDMSSSSPVDTRATGPMLTEKGATLIDAPVSGARPRALTGTLAIMIGGDDKAAIAKAKPILGVLGNQLFEVGSLGCGHATKALNNYIAGTGFVASCEAISIAKRFGLDPAVLADVLNVSTGKTFASEFIIKQHILSEEFASGFAIGLMAKDVGIAAALSEAVGYDAPIAALVRDRLNEARDALGFSVDNTAGFKVWDKSEK